MNYTRPQVALERREGHVHFALSSDPTSSNQTDPFPSATQRIVSSSPGYCLMEDPSIVTSSWEIEPSTSRLLISSCQDDLLEDYPWGETMSSKLANARKYVSDEPLTSRKYNSPTDADVWTEVETSLRWVPTGVFSMPSELEMEIMLAQDNVFVNTFGFCIFCYRANMPEYPERLMYDRDCHIRCGYVHESQSAFLNGSHGSFTGVDDHDQAGRARTFKEALNHQHQRPRQDANADRAARRVAEHAKAKQPDGKPVAVPQPQPPVPVPVPKTIVLVYDPKVPADYRYGWDGGSIFCFNQWEENYVGTDGVVKNAAPPSNLGQVESSGVGWYALQGDKGVLRVKTSPATYMCNVEEFTQLDGVVHQRVSYPWTE